MIYLFTPNCHSDDQREEESRLHPLYIYEILHFVQNDTTKKGEALASPSELRRPDSNRRPLGYEPNELPTAPLRDVYFLVGVDGFEPPTLCL